MIFSTSCSGSRYGFLFLGGVFLLLLGACTAFRTNGGSSGDRPDPFKVTALFPNRESPQVAEATAILWEARSAGGVGSLMYAFVLSDGTKERTVQDGPSPSWMWWPAAAGNYRVKVVARDEAGNVAESLWSAPYEVVPKLVVEVLYPDRGSPQAAESVEIRWEARSAGGVGSLVYAFVLSDGMKEQTVQDSPSPSWVWRPEAAGMYRVKVVARDEAGNVAERSWASDYEILPAFEPGATVAVMPMVNLTGTVTPMREIQSTWIGILKARGIRVLEGQILDDFMERHRIRYTGGMTKELGEALRKDTGAQGVLFTSLDLYVEPFPPKVALTARLVYAGRSADILWMDSIAIAGNDSPGILGIGLIRDPRDLRKKVMDQLAESLMDFLSGEKPRKSPGALSEGGKKFRPKEFFGYFQASARRNGPLVVAVLPFQDEGRRRYIGDIMMLHFVRHLASLDNVVVVEPGVVRHALLTSRTIMKQGLSIPQADLLREILHVNLVIEGWVMDYYDYQGPAGSPKVRFSTKVIDTRKRQVAWVALSYGQGDDGVFFFGAGKVNTAHVLASRMVQAVLAGIVRDSTGPERQNVTSDDDRHHIGFLLTPSSRIAYSVQPRIILAPP